MQLTQKIVCEDRNTHNILTVKNTMQEDWWKIWSWYLESLALWPWAPSPC